jgi:hypothetical protein
MKKKNILLFSLAVLLAFAFSSQNNLFSLVIPSAFADRDDSSSDDTQVTLCHFPPGGGGGALTLTVGTPALVNAHLAHGDRSGPCYVCPPGVSSCVGPDGNPGMPGTSQPASPDSQRDIYGK